MQFDFYVAEDKQNRYLGVLCVPNSNVIEQILTNIRDQYGLNREIKWNQTDKASLPIAVSWVRVAAWHSGIRFVILPWPADMGKGDVITPFLTRFCQDNHVSQIGGRFDAVAFLDFDNTDKTEKLQSYICRTANLLRCYGLNSKASNSLQLADVLLGATVRNEITKIEYGESVLSAGQWTDLEETLRRHQRWVTPNELSSSECKVVLARYFDRKRSRIYYEGATTGSRPAPP